jgi:CheY-like chemotaxis protein
MQNIAKNTKTCFLVDDDIDDQEIFMAAVSEIDDSINCVSVDNCEEAIEQLKKSNINTPDFIFLDLNMPRLNGRQCLAELKKIAHLKHVPVIIYSTSSLKKDIEETAKLGADMFLTKPSRFDDLCNALHQVLSKDWSKNRA